MDDTVIDWLSSGDPAIAWQVERDLLGADAERWEATRARVVDEGWGRRLLAERAADGLWAGGLYSPKWTSTTYTLLQLWRMGLPRDNPEAGASTAILLDAPVWMFGRGDRREECVAGFALALSSWFTIDDRRRDELTESILERQLEDGGWNCRTPRTGSTHGSFHTTINVVEGLREYIGSGGDRTPAVKQAERRAVEFFAEHRLYRSHRSDHIPDDRMTRIPFPPRWHHDVLRGLDWLRAADADPDPRFLEALRLVDGYRRGDGRWPVHANYSGAVWFTLESGRAPSRWNTLRGLRVMRWWEGRGGVAP